jgi:hypothetical protein
MGGQDRKIRGEAVTLRGSVFGHNYMDETEYDLTQGAFTSSASYSDLCGLLGISTVDGSSITPVIPGFSSIRILQPHFGELVECYIDFVSIHFPFDSFGTPGHNGAGSNDLQFGIGDFTNNDFTTPRTSYTAAEITASFQKMTGRTTGYVVAGGGDARITWNRINLLPALYKSGDSKFVEDGFNLIMMINTGSGAAATQGGTDTFKLEFFRITMSVTGIT